MRKERPYSYANVAENGLGKLMNHEHYFCENCGSYYDDYRRQDSSEYDDQK